MYLTIIIILLLIVGGLVYTSYKLSKRLLQFDELVSLLSEDIDTNLKYFEKLLSTQLFHASQEVITANNNMFIMSQRLNEFVLRFEELTNRKLLKKKNVEKNDNPPVVI